jgi:hypothetical protein
MDASIVEFQATWSKIAGARVAAKKASARITTKVGTGSGMVRRREIQLT